MIAERRLPGELIVIAAPSGTGKTSLVAALVANDERLTVSVSHSTRPQRPGEIEGKHYFFVSTEEFQAMSESDRFLESARVYGHLYATSREVVQRNVSAGLDVILEIDWQGARSIRRQWPSAWSVFLLPPSRTSLEQRLRARRQDSDEVIAARMAQAVAELSHHDEFDCLIVNDDFDETLELLQHVIHARRTRTEIELPDQSEFVRQLIAEFG